MAEPKNVALTQEQYDFLMSQTKQNAELMKRLEKLEQAPKGPGMETTAMRYSKDINARMKGETHEEAMKSIMVVKEPSVNDGPGLTYLVDKCPFCIKENKGVRIAEFDPHKSSILDMTQGGKYSCRRCGKHWHPWAIFPEQSFPEYGIEGPLTYSIHVEQGNLEKVEAHLKLDAARKGEAITK